MAENYDWFDLFDNILIGLDNDKAGQKAALQVAEVLPKHKVKIVTWSGKDPNQMLEDGKQKQFVRDFYNAKDYINSGISSSVEAEKEIDEFLMAQDNLTTSHAQNPKGWQGWYTVYWSYYKYRGDTSIGKSFCQTHCSITGYLISPIIAYYC